MSTNTTGTPESTAGRDATTLKRGEIGLAGVMMPGLAQVAPAFNLFFTAGVMAGLACLSVPLIFLISLVGLVATAASLALFSGVYPSAARSSPTSPRPSARARPWWSG